MTAEPVAPIAPGGLLASFRRRPAQASELLALHGLTALAPALRRRPAGPVTDQAGTAEAVQAAVDRAARRAGRDGVITGTAFVVAYPAALGSLYLTQTLMVLEIAAAYGHDPTDPGRAAELLVIRGRHATLEQAAAALAAACSPRPVATPGGRSRPSRPAALAMMRTGAGRLRSTPVADLFLGIMGVASFVVPFVGVPACSYGARRATRRLGQRATQFYADGRPATGRTVELVLPEPPSFRAGLAAAAAVVVTILLGLVLSMIWVGDGHHGLWRIGLAVLWVFVLTAHIRLGLLLRSAVRR